jgi:hypothetical protein
VITPRSCSRSRRTCTKNQPRGEENRRELLDRYVGIVLEMATDLIKLARDDGPGYRYLAVSE